MMKEMMNKMVKMVMAVSVYGIGGFVIGTAILILAILAATFGLCGLFVVGIAFTNLIGLTAIPFTAGAGVLVVNPLLQILMGLVTAGVLVGMAWLCTMGLKASFFVFSTLRTAIQ